MSPIGAEVYRRALHDLARREFGIGRGTSVLGEADSLRALLGVDVMTLPSAPRRDAGTTPGTQVGYVISDGLDEF